MVTGVQTCALPIYQGTIPAGGSTRLVLVFQVPDDVASADSVELYVQMDQMIQIIL